MQTNKPDTSSTAGLMDLLLRSGEALQNWRALVTLMGTGLVTVIVVIAIASLGNMTAFFLSLLIAYLIVSVGISATGILLMDQALGTTPRSISAALIDGIFAAIRLFVLTLIGVAVALAVILVASILVVFCKIPGLGGLLYAIVFPACVLVVAFVYAGLYFVYSMAGAAVWSGASIRQSVAALYAIITHRLVESALGVIVHSLLMMIIGGIISAFVFAGVGVVVALSAGILGGDMGVSNMPAMLMNSFGGLVYGGGMRSMGGMGAMGGSCLLYGGMFGFGILLTLLGAALLSMMILGLNRLYLHLTATLDLASAEAALINHIDTAKERGRAMQEEARRRAEEMRQRSQAPAQARPEPAPLPIQPSAASLVCPNCSQKITASDKFCENCGHTLA